MIPIRFPRTAQLLTMQLLFCASLSGSPVTEKINSIQAEMDTTTRLEKWAIFSKEIALEEISEVLELAGELNQWRDRAVLQSVTLSRWANFAPRDAAETIAKFPEGRHKINCFEPVIRQWATANPKAAAEFSMTLEVGQCRRSQLISVAEIWAEKDAIAALSWSDSLPASQERDEILQSILFVWVHVGPAASWERIKLLPPGTSRNSLVSNVASAMGRENPMQAVEWANALSDPEERDLAFCNIAEGWADRNPADAAKFVSALPAGAARPYAAAAVAGAWAYQAPEQAALWILTLDPMSQQQAFPRLVTFWADMDPKAAGKWLTGLPNTPFRDYAISKYCEFAVNWYPQDAANLALTVSDKNLREQTLSQLLDRWKLADSKGSESWRNANPEFKLPTSKAHE